jgi:hypothetical protein
MASPKAVIDECIIAYDGCEPGEVLDAKNTIRRRLYLSWLNFASAYLNGYRPWPWMHKEGDPITLGIGDNKIELATDITDFHSWGPNGHLYSTTQNIIYIRKPMYLVQQLRRRNEGGGGAGVGTGFNIFTHFGGSIQFPFVATSAISFIPFYVRTPPVYTSDTDEDEMILPDQYVRLVVIPFLGWRGQHSKNDARTTWAEQMKEGLSQMCALENPLRDIPQQAPMAVRRGGW